jgi:hypothetical protein
VTKFILKSHPQSDIWVGRQERLHIGDLLEIWQGAVLFYAEDQLDAIREALVSLEQKNDPKAATEVSLAYSSGQVCSVMTSSPSIETDPH